ncbi:Retrovirus-related Pol polyprotein from transposon RE2; Endonuclease RE2 [Eumeta japonica]|uniref:Retrovirus-related Pol polyprotein from transposon RE2 Endonuclease RE2 n=1 Tax=Eumeta variegata TaxID=151549 RepID=A0A4C2ACV3_EUMVA|nr:Retrovirus-related Pol polyprotein from transposon RE2; Endonuclease RE2 [Eumeta japonica]
MRRLLIIHINKQLAPYCMWLQGTRPDISFAVNTLSRFNKNPTAEHWNAVKRIFRYLQGTKDLKLTYTKDGDENITGYCDADWGATCAIASRALVTLFCYRVALYLGDHISSRL